MDYIKLGASLYLPATRSDLSEIVINNKFSYLKSIIIDTEDSVAENELEVAYDKIKKLLIEIPIKNDNLLIFIRPRNPQELKKILSFKNIEKVHGFVLPKFCCLNMSEYIDLLPNEFWYMPILEKDIFTEADLIKIRDFILLNTNNLLSVRIGITDILNVTKTRRNHSSTIYKISTASHIISRIIYAFAPHNINVTGTVFEYFGKNSQKNLSLETKEDLQNGIFGKSAIHPSQVLIINEQYKVSTNDYETACKILNVNSPAVFKLFDTMQEKATHFEWATKIKLRKEIYGFK